MHEIALAGCRPAPLAHYLKALAVLRLVAADPDPAVRGAWQGDTFVLHTHLAFEELEAFFLEHYRPTPIIAPWNGGSGFYPKDNTTAIEAIEASSAPRFALYRDAISTARSVLDAMGLDDKVSKEQKLALLERCRGRLSDEAVTWLDAAYVITPEGAKYPPLLGTGGNDGRLEFTNNFMQWIVALFHPDGTPQATTGPLLRAALRDDESTGLASAAIGQFLPGGAGGANAGQGFGAGPRFNPWDFVLMLEGAISFGGAGARRLRDNNHLGTAAYPFTVQHAGTGFGTASSADEGSGNTRGEMWLPLWEQPSTAAEVAALLSEGRATIGRRRAKNGVDFARAVAGLGVDRGIGSFQRYGFLVRNGLSYFATPLTRFDVKRSPGVDLLADPKLDAWLERFRSCANDARAPGGVKRESRALASAIVDLCAKTDAARVRAVIVALGRCERQLAQSLAWSAEPKRGLTPVPPLRAEWLAAMDDGSVELRLAASLASVFGADGALPPLREQIEPVATSVRGGNLRVWWDAMAGRDVAWGSGSMTRNMIDVLARRVMLARQGPASSYPDRGRLDASLGDIADFIAGRTQEGYLLDLFFACLLINWPSVQGQPLRAAAAAHEAYPSAFYGLMKLCFLGHKVRDTGIAVEPTVVHLARRGRSDQAARAAVHRLRAHDLHAAAAHLSKGSGGARWHLLAVAPDVARRSTAALLFPISKRSARQLSERILRPGDIHESTSTHHNKEHHEL